MKSTIANNSVWVAESPISVVDGEKYTMTCRYPGKTVTTTDGFCKLWKNGTTDVSGNNLSGSISANSDTLTLKTMNMAGGGNNFFILEWACTVNGNIVIRKCRFDCQSEQAA